MPETKAIPLHSITVAIHRLRKLRSDKVDALAQSMADQGLLQPIVVRPHKNGGYWLVAGRHRFEAAKKRKWTEINCTVFDDMEADQAELIEIDENLIRSDLSPAEEAMHLARRKELYEKVHGKSKAKGARAANKKMGKTTDATDNLSDAFTTDVAKKTGQTARNIRRKVARSKNVTVLSGIVGTSLDKGCEIDALAKLPAAEQRSLAEAAKGGEKVSAITAHSACDPEDPKMSNGTELAMQDLDRLTTFKRHTLDPEAIWVCDQLELAWQALRGQTIAGRRSGGH